MNDERKTRTGDMQEREWTGGDWAGEPAAPETGRDDQDRWNKTEWVGDHGEGQPGRMSPAEMPEGETAISGNRHPSGEQHWAEGQEQPTPVERPDERARKA